MPDLTVSAEDNLMNNNGGHDGAISLGSSVTEHLASDSVSGVGLVLKPGSTVVVSRSKRAKLKKKAKFLALKNMTMGTRDGNPAKVEDGCLEEGVCSDLMNNNGGHGGAISLGSSVTEHLASDSLSGVGLVLKPGSTVVVSRSKRAKLKKKAKFLALKNMTMGTRDGNPAKVEDGCLEEGVCSESRKISLETGLKQAETVASSVKEAQPEIVSHFVKYGDGLLLVGPNTLVKEPLSEKDSDPNPSSIVNSGSLFEVGVSKLDHKLTPSQRRRRQKKEKKMCDVSGGICISNVDNEERNKCEDLKRLVTTLKDNLTDAENACCNKRPRADSLLSYWLRSGSQGGEETSSVRFTTEESDSQLICSGSKRKRQEVSRENMRKGNENSVLNDNILVNKSQLTKSQNTKKFRRKAALDPKPNKVRCIVPAFLSSVGRLCIGPPKKKLLVLDLNGILVDVVKKKVEACYRKKVDYSLDGKKVFKRPFCDDFMNFCFQRFHVGIWSSRIMKNVFRICNCLFGDSMNKLVFCWYRSYCTKTKLKTLEEESKPLVLKELRKLWEKGANQGLPWEKGQYNESNTILVDDSPYKALRNPAYSSIFPYPYKYDNDEDSSLGCGGDLRVYLEGLAEASNVQKYVEENPFGQPAITELDPSWDYYKKILITSSWST